VKQPSPGVSYPEAPYSQEFLIANYLCWLRSKERVFGRGRLREG